jgi:hypothetical protein
MATGNRQTVPWRRFYEWVEIGRSGLRSPVLVFVVYS